MNSQSSVSAPRRTEPLPAIRHLSEADIQAFGDEVKQIGAAVMNDLGARDERYLRGLLWLHRTLEVGGRLIIFAGILHPLLAGPYFLPVLLANMGANLIRNLWAYAVIFCGHFSDGVEDFSEEDVENEDRARWCLRQVLGSANIEGGPALHFWSGNLSHQIEHHLYPAMPSNRYQEVAPQIRDLCRRYGIPYNSRPLLPQLFSVWRKVFRYALPPGRVSTST